MPTRILVVDDSPTIRRVVSTILARHGYESAQAVDGEDAMRALTEGGVVADLVLVDFVMPRMNGFQFCRALREHAGLASTPVVLMSAKGDRIRDQFVEQTGALDAITKPFDAQVLVAVIANALRRANTGESAARMSELDSEELIEDVESGELLNEETELTTQRTHMAQLVATKLAHVVMRILSERPGATAGELAGSLAERLTNEAIFEMLEMATGRVNGPLLAGDLGIIPIGAILQLLQVESQSGALACKNGSIEVTATFRNGLIDLVQSSGAGDEFRLGRFFVEEGIVDADTLEAVLDLAKKASKTSSRPPRDDAPPSQVHAKVEDTPIAPPTRKILSDLQADLPTVMELPSFGPPEPRLLGQILLDAGKITEADLRSALTRQSSELLYEVLRWSRGRFELRRIPPSALAQSTKLGMPVAAVVMEGFRRVDEWRVLERTIGSFEAILVRDDHALGALDLATLPVKERAVLDAVDGGRSVRAIVAASHMSSFDACRILVSLLEARILRRRGG